MVSEVLGKILKVGLAVFPVSLHPLVLPLNPQHPLFHLLEKYVLGTHWDTGMNCRTH